jgi:alpha-glucosidase (family GH31 glycosyl hydrolase)
MPLSALHAGNVLEYNAHNMYGLMESIATREALESIRRERPFVLSRSTFLSSGTHTAHWTGDNAATWDDLRASIITMNSLSMFGISVSGADICGFGGDSNEELCGRWAQVGAFSTFMRNHNTLGAAPQEFYRWDSVADIARTVINMRYSLLPELYTLLYLAERDGITVHNALWTHFPEDAVTTSGETDAQYMWADRLLFTPVVSEGATSVKGYFPKGIWWVCL